MFFKKNSTYSKIKRQKEKGGSTGQSTTTNIHSKQNIRKEIRK